MIKSGAVSMITGILLSVIFIGIALYLLFIPDGAPHLSKDDLRRYALLTGSYGLWRFIRVFIVWKETKKNV
jgi:NhaP-type Na+/H+ or K+/H+ antiporter